MNSDELLQRHVLEELDWEPSIDAAKIGVTACDGVLTLTGRVPVYTEKVIAEKVAKRVHGARGVVNEIDVVPSELHHRDDAELAEAVLHAIKWHAHAPHDRIQVTVRDGRVLLEGSVDWHFQRAAAERAVRHLHGVRAVENRIGIAAGAANGEIRSSIETALRRSAMLNSKDIGVEAEQCKVVLTGDVHSHSEVEEAERVAWSARGVAEVENCLTITPWGSGPSEEWGY